MNRPSIYTRPDKPLVIPVKDRREPAPMQVEQLAEPIRVDAATECHVTPSGVARRMVIYLGAQGDFNTLEPSAGTGQLVRALLESGHSANELTMIERHVTLANGLHQFGPTINRCFLEYAEDARGKVEFPRILMNPPFKKVRQHINAALSLLGTNGHDVATLVALVPVTFEHPEATTLELLPVNTFSTAKVYTKIIRIERN